MKRRMNDFVLKGLFAQRAIVDLQDRGLLRPSVASDDERATLDFYAPVPEHIRTGSLAMQRSFRMLFVFENLIRDFVDQRLSELDGSDWFNTRATSAMKSKVQDRKDKEQRNNWHIGRNSHPIYYLDFGDLGLLMINHWSAFRDFFEEQSWVQSRIAEAERTRNVIAHTNRLADEEADRLQMYLRDWMKQTL